MAMNFLSPGVNFEEVDNTLTTQSAGMWAGAAVIQSGWGPIEEPTYVDSQTTLVDIFGKPTANNFKSWFCASNYLDYTSSLYVVRSNATGLVNASTGAQSSPLLIKNETDYSLNYMDGQGNAGQFAAKYAGAKGNSLLVTYADKSSFDNWILKEVDDYGDPIYGTSVVEVKINNAGAGYKTTDVIKFTDSAHGRNASFGFTVGSAGEITSVWVVNPGTGYISTDQLEIVTTTGTQASLSADLQLRFDCRELFSYTPNTSVYAEQRGGRNDEMHMLVIDRGGRFSGSRYTVLEKYEGVSKASDCKSMDGVSNFYKRVLLDQSQYVYWMDFPTGVNWGYSVTGTTFNNCPNDTFFEGIFDSGVNDYNSTDSDIMLAFDEFKNKEAYDITNVICGPYSKKVAKYVVESICEDRLDCVAFISPNADGGPIKGTLTEITANTIDWRTDPEFNVNSSYAVMDSGWKYQYDKFNDEYRWIPLCADVAGLRARTSENQYPWFSEAGYNRGQIKNVIKLSYNPSKAYRDLLYPKGINPVVTFAGQGTILYGDKTLLTKPSAFQHTNVRFLFIYLEKTLTDAAKYLLFEINDDITRAYAKNLCEPFLDEVLGSRGIYAYKVVCDTSNNTDLVIDNNKFALDIYVQPARSINFINMKFVANKTGSSFTEGG